MQIVKNNVEYIPQEKGYDGILKAVMKSAFISYQTIKSNLTPEQFINKVLLENGHGRPLEFGTCYMIVPKTKTEIIEKYKKNPYSRVKIFLDGDNVYITTNLRVIMQGDYIEDHMAWKNKYDRNWMSDIKEYLSDPVPGKHDLRHTFNVIISRGCSDDLRTHISLSSICESTRYCMYTKSKFGNQLTYTEPYFLSNYTDDKPVPSLNDVLSSSDKNEVMYGSYKIIEELYKHYMSLDDVTAQEGKRILPLGIKAELQLCGYTDSWFNFLWRRADSHADPECQVVAKEIEKILYDPLFVL